MARAIHTPEQLARELGRRVRALRERVVEQLAGDPGPLLELRAELGHADPDEFADDYAQAVGYALLTRAVDRAAAQLDAGLLDRMRTIECVYDEIAYVSELFESIDVAAIFENIEDPVLSFYEHFLDAYEPAIRRKMGVWYTPLEVVESMVDEIDAILREHLGLRLGLADPISWADYAAARGLPVPAGVAGDEPVVQILDPATGTGTFLLRVIERVHATMRAEYAALGLSEPEAAARWREYVRAALLPRLYGFERMLAPCLICRLRLALALAQTGVTLAEADRIRVFATDTLALDSDDEAAAVKRERPILVVLGNPPYERIATADDPSAAWIADIREVAREHATFSHLRSLPDRYVYFWRWALDKVFEQREGPGVVALISNATWLTGPAFVGLRKLVRELSDEVQICDLGGEAGGPRPEPNVFAITTPVAITTAIRATWKSPDSSLARVHYRRIFGESREAKLAALRRPSASQLVAGGPLAPLVPASGDAAWRGYPALIDLFPWQQPGCLASRTWPIAPDPDTLRARWQAFVRAPVAARPDLFATARTGRNIHTKVPGYPPLASLGADAEPEPIVRYGLRSFDRQWILADPRLLKTESPALWRSRSAEQVYLSSLLSAAIAPGPALTVTALVPDFHHFRGSYGGKDVLPLYRDAAATQANVTAGLLEALGERLAIAAPSPEQLAAYVYALLSSPAYQRRFCDALARPGPRVPLTGDPALWAAAVSLGERLIWLHTYAERWRDPAAGRGSEPPRSAELVWSRELVRMPEHPRELSYDRNNQTLRIGDGELAGVRPEVWDYSVSGFRVVKRWLASRTAHGSGRAARSQNPLDRIRPNRWVPAWTDELLELLGVLTATIELAAAQAELLAGICDGPQIAASELPQPDPAQRRPP